MLTEECSFAIGIVGDAGVRGSAQQPRLYVGMILILIFAEVLGQFSLLLGPSHKKRLLTVLHLQVFMVLSLPFL